MEYNCTSCIFDDIKIEETSPVPDCMTPTFELNVKQKKEHINNNNIYLDILQIMLSCYKNNFISDKSFPEYFECAECGRSFDTKSEIKKHFLTCTEIAKHNLNNKSESFNCSNCGNLYKHKGSLQKHLRSCKVEETNTDCNKKFQSEAELKFHLQSCEDKSTCPRDCTSSEPFCCRKCNKCFKKIKSLYGHLRSHATQLTHSKYNCNKCEFECKTQKILRHHEKNCTFKGDITDCNHKFQKDSELKEHLRLCKNTSSSPKNCTGLRPFCCNLCGARFKKGMYLTAHLTNHSKAIYECKKCGKIYKSEEPLAKHLHFCKSFEGDITNCNRKFQTDAELKEHLKICKTPSDSPKNCNSMKPFCCKSCDSTFASRSYLAQHIVNHLQERFHCDKCDKLLKTQESLDRHLEECQRMDEGDITDCNRKFQNYEELGRHLKLCKNVSDSPKNCTSVKPLCCKLCDSRFSQKKHLIQHASVHGEKKLECATCGLKYRHAAGLWRHEQRTHVGKLYQCLKCDKSYVRSENLKKHMKTHDKEVITKKHRNKYACGLCDASYSKCSDLRTHLMQHARGKLFRCKICNKSHHNADLLVIHMRSHP